MPTVLSRPKKQQALLLHYFESCRTGKPFRSTSFSKEQVPDPQPSLPSDINEGPNYTQSSSFSSDDDKEHVNLVWKNVRSWYICLPPFQQRRLAEMGFDGLLSVDSFALDPVLLNYVIARFRRETNSFYFDFGEMIISLEDVVRITGLRVQGLPVTGTRVASDQDLSMKILGQHYVEYCEGEISLSWLSDTFSQGIPLAHHDGESWEEYLDRARQHKARGVAMVPGERADRELRAFLLYLFGYVLFPNITTASVSDVWLQLLVDLDEVGEYAWGAAVASHLFSHLGSRLGDTNTVVGFLPLLQVWIWEHLDFLRPCLGENAKDIFPRLRRWSKRFWAEGDRDGVDVAQSSNILLEENRVIWQPYDVGAEDELPFIQEAAPFFCRDVWLHCFNMVQRHYASRALRQFALRQGIPADPLPLHVELPEQSLTKNFETIYSEQLSNWDHHGNVVDEAPDNISLEDYMAWYKPILSPSGGASDSVSINTSESELMESYDQLKYERDLAFSRMAQLECTIFELQRVLDQGLNEALGKPKLLCESNASDPPKNEMERWMELIVERCLRSLEVKNQRGEGSRKVAGMEDTIARMEAKIKGLEAKMTRRQKKERNTYENPFEAPELTALYEHVLEQHQSDSDSDSDSD